MGQRSQKQELLGTYAFSISTITELVLRCYVHVTYDDVNETL